MPYSFIAALVTARMAALRPGQSPPDVRIPMQFVFVLEGIINHMIQYYITLTQHSHIAVFMQADYQNISNYQY
jgi:hypothetical protein